MLIDGLVGVDAKALDAVSEVLVESFSTGRNIFVCGNGGSAAIADHFCCDHSKGVYADTGFLPQIQPLTGNISTLTAIANDMGYDKVFSHQIHMKGTTGDVLIAISSSGNSPNIIDALNRAKLKKMTTIALVGFDGGAAKNIADHVIHVNCNNYGVVEDSHQALMHIMAQSIRLAHLNKVTTTL